VITTSVILAVVAIAAVTLASVRGSSDLPIDPAVPVAPMEKLVTPAAPINPRTLSSCVRTIGPRLTSDGLRTVHGHTVVTNDIATGVIRSTPNQQDGGAVSVVFAVYVSPSLASSAAQRAERFLRESFADASPSFVRMRDDVKRFENVIWFDASDPRFDLYVGKSTLDVATRAAERKLLACVRTSRS
jgi:hypothetical protein